MNMRLSLLGPVQVVHEGQPVYDLPLGKPLALLGYLITQRKPLLREHLADLFWPDLPADRGRANLSWMLHKLTTVLPACVEANRNTVRFHRSETCWIDIDVFETLTAQGDTQSLQEAAALYRGDLLEGFTLDSCAEFQLWLVAERERWRQRVERALNALIVHHAEARACDEALRYARRLLALAPWREGTHRQVMRLFAEQGQRGAALAQYKACCRALKAELGVAPSPETVALYEQICDDAIPLPPPSAAPEAPAPRHNLPTPLTPFIGQESLLAEVRGCLLDPACRLLTLVGPGGSGKTRLALAVARTQIDHYDDGVYLVSLAALHSANAMVPAVAQALGFPFYKEGDLRQQLLDYLRGKRMLLLLDNFEHLLDGVDLALQILRIAPETKILVTSRARLNLQVEYLYSVEGLDYPEQTDRPAQNLRRYDAVRLFLDGVQRVKPDFALSSDRISTIAKICRLVEGMPLAILLAAAWSDTLDPREIATEIEQNLDFLATDWHDLPERQRSMRAVFDNSWNLLTTRSREAMRALSVFRGSFSSEAAQAVTGATKRELRVLIDKSLLHRTTEDRFELHQLLQKYAFEKLDWDAKERDAVQARHSDTYIRFLGEREAALKGHGQRVALVELRAEMQNARAAWQWATAHIPKTPTTAQLSQLNSAVESLWLSYDIHAWFQEGEQAFREATEVLEMRAKGGQSRIAARVLARQARFSYRLGSYEESQELYQRSLEICRRLGADTEMAFPYYGLGCIARDREEHRKANQYFHESLALYRQSEDPWGIANTLHHLGVAAYKLGEFARAEQLHREALTARRGTGERWGTAKSLKALGAVIHDLGDPDRARQLYQESYTLYEELGDQRGMAAALNNLAAVAWGNEAFGEAKQLLQETLRIGEDIGDHKGIALALTNLGYVARLQGAYAEARDYYQQNLIKSRERGDQWGVALSFIDLGAVARELGEYAEAKRYYRECVAICQEIDHLWGKALSLNRLGRIAYKEASYEQAKRYYEESIAISQEIGDLRAIATTFSDLGDVARASGDYQGCRRYLQNALGVATTTWTAPFILDIATRTAELLTVTQREEAALALVSFVMHCSTDHKTTRDRAGHLHSELTSRLPAQLAGAAQLRGQSWDLRATAEALQAVLADERVS